jgi:mannose-6-phosphate isomerase
MGTHPAAPSVVLPTGEHLRGWLARNRDALGSPVDERWGGDLPFLFKVLSVAKPLSIQAHPDKALAEELHALRPDAYRDANHKPEMAIAITHFRALFGFVGIEVRRARARAYPSHSQNSQCAPRLSPLVSRAESFPRVYVCIFFLF